MRSSRSTATVVGLFPTALTPVPLPLGFGVTHTSRRPRRASRPDEDRATMQRPMRLLATNDLRSAISRLAALRAAGRFAPAAALALGLVAPSVLAAQTLKWYKGNTHTHTLNSDGDSSPDEVARWYREHG